LGWAPWPYPVAAPYYYGSYPVEVHEEAPPPPRYYERPAPLPPEDEAPLK
jgi:hypothetical protein